MPQSTCLSYAEQRLRLAIVLQNRKGGVVIYRALYRKWRPQTFADVIGQAPIISALSNQISADKVGHAYIFTGTRGTGKTSCAKIFAKAVNCEEPVNTEPCGKCPMCTGVDNGSILDVVEIDAASNNGVDDVRDLRDETAYRPSRGRYRVYIVDEVHMLSTAAFNALLKILEEPPSHVIFILATTEIHKVPPTILSRCQRFDFMRIAPSLITQRLQYIAAAEQIVLDEAAADLIARLADGAMRDALSLLDTCASLGGDIDVNLVRSMAGVADKQYLFAINKAVCEGDKSALLQQLQQLHQGSLDAKRLCEELVVHFRNLLLAKTSKDGELLVDVPQIEQQQYIDVAAQTSENFAINAMFTLVASLDKMSRSFDPSIELELALFTMCDEIAGRAQKPVTQPAAANAGNEIPQAQQSVPLPPTAPAPIPAEQPPFTIEVPSVESPPAPKVDPAPPQKSEQPASDHISAPPIAAPTQPRDAQHGPMQFELWPQVLHQMSSIDKMLFSYMSESKAYVKDNFVLIDAGELFLTFIRTNADAKERIRSVIKQVSGKAYNLGPYTPEESQPAVSAAKQTLEQWQKMGVEIDYQ